MQENDVEDDDAEEDEDDTVCVSLRSRHFNISQEPLYTDIYRKSARAQNLGAHFVRACTIEMHVNMS